GAARPPQHLWRRAVLRPGGEGNRADRLGRVLEPRSRFRAFRPAALPRGQGRPARDGDLHPPCDRSDAGTPVPHRAGSAYPLFLMAGLASMGLRDDIARMMPETPKNPTELRELLSFYADAGVDEALEEEAQDRFAAPRAE